MQFSKEQQEIIEDLLQIIEEDAWVGFDAVMDTTKTVIKVTITQAIDPPRFKGYWLRDTNKGFFISNESSYQDYYTDCILEGKKEVATTIYNQSDWEPRSQQ